MRVSTLTDRERLDIKSTLDIMDNKKWQCNECLSEPRAELLDKKRELYGCKGEPSHGKTVYKTNDFEYKICPGNFYSYRAAHYLETYLHFERGILPYPGSLLDQPAKILDIFAIINSHRQAKLDRDVSKTKSKDGIKERGRQHQRQR